MRPEILFPVFANITSLPGVGPKTKAHYERLTGGGRIIDLLYHRPIAIIDRRKMPPLYQMQHGDVITAVVKVDQHIPPKNKSSPYKIICSNATGGITLVFFNAYADYLHSNLPIGQVRVISGRAETFGGSLQMPHPDYIVPEARINEVLRIEPIYPLTSGLSMRVIGKTINEAIKKTPNLPEWIAPEMLEKNNWRSWKDSITVLHNPREEAEIAIQGNILRRLAYDEILVHQLALKLNRKLLHSKKGRAIKGDGILRKILLDKLPFALTEGQKEVIKEINADQESENRMARLLQGDVGSGKTVVALFAALNAVEAGTQAVIMAPTEILAGQHYKWIEGLLQGMKGIREKDSSPSPLNPLFPSSLGAALLTGSTKPKEREEILAKLKNGEINIVIGTHALFQDKVEFDNLGLVVIDEQHRFGVKQRAALAEKGNNCDILIMTATPIPRSLTMAIYGDMECSRLTEKPSGRKTIDTRVMPSNKIGDIVEGLKRVIEKGEKIYWICPLVEESEKSELAAVDERFSAFKRIFGDKVGVVHGRMKGDERAKTMLEFKEGNIDILVATTVIEVGVDVPDATTIIIEHAERFGLSQLHQLRGRVGRNDKQSTCILLYYGLGEVAKQRLSIMRESNDGFRLAEEDLKIRGGGDIMGEKQSGLPSFKIANLYEHSDLFQAAGRDAATHLEADPYFKSERGRALRLLFHIFEYDLQEKVLGA